MNETITITAAEYPWPYAWYWQGIALIKEIQRIEHPVLTGIIRWITGMGSLWFYIPAVLLILWCVDEKRGFRLGAALLVSLWANLFFKNLLKQPRPYTLDPSVGRAFESSYGMPSGHAQQSLVFWTALKAFRPWGALIITGIMGFTRLYLGVHFPADLLGGWLLGGLILAGAAWWRNTLEPRLAAGGTRAQLLCAAAAALVMNAAETAIPVGGMFLGFCAGYSLMRRRRIEPFSWRTGKPGLPVLAARYLIGMTGAAALYQGLAFLLPGPASLFAGLPGWGAASPYAALSRFVQYGLLGLWASCGAPRLFRALGLPRSNHGE
ncbi:MAG: phosphatase PAP2 family protein [Treponema sp.]|jgi:membrane-associated phospholipid phosphatase|nr:phosphatase PAP2 family protein [Treponema sp.]